MDVGPGNDSLGQYVELFPLITSVIDWDVGNGDAQYLNGVADGKFDFLYSSHCLEHLVDPEIALVNWVKVVRSGGYIIVSVPDEDLYEQGQWPSTFNSDHKHTFTICKSSSWSPVSVNVVDLLMAVDDLAHALSITTIDSAYRHSLYRTDQTHSPLTESSIEFILRRL
jgi:SAM-dependent methyltransferase